MSPVSEQAPVFVLVHSPLVGPLTWTLVADVLRRRGHTVVLPRLDNPNDTPGTLFHHHAEQVRQAVEAHSRTAPVVLVGHSGAGALLPAAGDTLANETAGYVFVDAGLPRDRTSRLDDAPPQFAERLHRLAEGDRVPPWAEWWSDDVLAALIPDEDLRERFAAELEPIPLVLFEERISVPPAWPDAPCGYLLLSSAYEEEAARAARRGWEVVSLETGHLHMLVGPDAVADALEDVARRLVAAPAPRPDDPIAVRRARIGGWVETGRRVGFTALAVAVLLFAVALYWDLPTLVVQAIVGCLALATVSLLPSMIVGYGLAAAEREDRRRRRGAGS